MLRDASIRQRQTVVASLAVTLVGVLAVVVLLLVCIVLLVRRGPAPPGSVEERARRVGDALGRAERRRRAAQIAEQDPRKRTGPG